MTCPWPTGWRQLESLGEAQLDGGGVTGLGLTLGCGGGVSAWGQRGNQRPEGGGSPPRVRPAQPCLLCTPGWVSALAGPCCCLTLVSPSRVHITEATLNHLDKAYEVEDGHGQQRDPYLKEMNIRTYLVIDPRVRGSAAAGWGATLGLCLGAGPTPGAWPPWRERWGPPGVGGSAPLLGMV